MNLCFLYLLGRASGFYSFWGGSRYFSLICFLKMWGEIAFSYLYSMGFRTCYFLSALRTNQNFVPGRPSPLAPREAIQLTNSG